MIRSTFGAFMTARSGIVASQLALNVTGQNMANVNVNGYTRQRLDLVSMKSSNASTKYAMIGVNIGQGVHATGVTQLRDPTLDARFRTEYGQLGELDTHYSTLYQLESILNEFSMSGMTTQINDLLLKLNELSSNAESAEFDGMVRSSADLLCKLLNGYASGLAGVRDDLTSELDEIDIPRVNDIMEQLSELNVAIRKAQSAGSSDLELQDQRNLLLDELSLYMDIKVSYSKDTANPNMQNIKIELKVDGGQNITLMENGDHVGFKTSVDVDGNKQILIDTYGASPQEIDLSDKLTTGAFKGVLDMLNKNGEYDVPASDVRGIGYYEKMLDTLAASFAGALNEANKAPNPAYDPLDPLSEEFLDRPLFESSDGGPITAANLRISQAWLTGEYGVTTTKLPDAGEGAQDNITYIISLFSESFVFTNENGDALYKGTFNEFFGSICGTLEREIETAKTLAKNKAIVVESVTDMRSSISAVSLDEEAVNMMMYQKSFNAASRLMTTLDEALDQLINRMGVVGR